MHNIRKLYKIFVILIVSLSAQGAENVVKYHSHEDIFQSVIQYLKDTIVLPQNDELKIKTGRLDSRIRFRQCEANLEHFLPNTPDDNINIRLVGVRCASPKHWQVYIPVVLDILTPAVVAKFPLSKNNYISAANLTIKPVSRKKLRTGYFRDIKNVTGKTASTFISQNNVIKPSMVKTPKIIARGQFVKIVAVHENLEVSAKGVALMQGSKGEMIRVKNNRSNRIIEALVVSPGTVEVYL